MTDSNPEKDQDSWRWCASDFNFLEIVSQPLKCRVAGCNKWRLRHGFEDFVLNIASWLLFHHNCSISRESISKQCLDELIYYDAKLPMFLQYPCDIFPRVWCGFLFPTRLAWLQISINASLRTKKRQLMWKQTNFIYKFAKSITLQNGKTSLNLRFAKSR